MFFFQFDSVQDLYEGKLAYKKNHSKRSACVYMRSIRCPIRAIVHLENGSVHRASQREDNYICSGYLRFFSEFKLIASVPMSLP